MGKVVGNNTMSDQKKLIAALQQHHSTPLQARMAGIILKCDGIIAALDYVTGVNTAISLDAAEAAYLNDIAAEDFFREEADR